METFLTILLDGLQFSSYLFIVSAGLTIIFGVMKILNVAHGSFYAWGAYTAAFFIGKFSDMGMPDAIGFLIIVAAAIVVGLILGFVIEQGILKYMYHRDEVLIVLATFGLFLVLEDIILIAFGTDPYFAYQPMALLDSVELGGIVRDVYGLTLIAVAALVALGCWYLLNKTKWGTLLKAVIYDREMGISMGINVPLVYTLTFIGGAILGGLGGAYIAPTISVAPGLGTEVIVLSFAVVVVGGMGSIAGAAIGSIIIGNNKNRMVNVVVVDPPEPFISFRYRCDSRFELTQLEDMLVDNKSYGLFVIDRSEAAYGIASGKRIHVQEHLVSNIMGKHRQGGQSAQRFERLIEEAAHNFFKRATEHACNYWLPNLENIQAVIIGGPGATKDFVVKNDYFHHEITKKIAKTTFDVGYSNESGVRELVDNAGDLMGEIELDQERQSMNVFLRELVQQQPKATYGEAMIRQALEGGAVSTLLISESLRKNIVELECQSCQHTWSATLNRNQALPACPSCKAKDDAIKEVGSKSLIDHLSELALASRSEVVFISIDTEEGAQLMNGFGGLAAVLRYPIM